jgi:hypothetical protein
MTDRTKALADAAQAVIERWDSPKWADEAPTAGLIYRLRLALENHRAAQQAPSLTVGDEPETVPWPSVTAYSGGGSADGVAGRLWVTLDYDGPAVEFVRATQSAAQAEPVAWAHTFNGHITRFINTVEEARFELERLNREYPRDAHLRSMRPLVYGDAPASNPPAQGVELPPLPDSAHSLTFTDGPKTFYTADALRAYAQAARTAALEAACDKVAFYGGPVDLEAAIRALIATGA